VANVTTSDDKNNNPKVNPAKFMGSAFAAGSALSKKVAANAKKITLIKKVLQAQRIAIGESLKPVKDPLLEGVKEQIQETNSVLKDIGNALALDFANRIAEEKEDTKRLKKQKDMMRKSLAEKGLEGIKGIGKSVSSGIRKVGSGIANTFNLGKLIQVVKLLGAGIAINAAFEWLKSDENRAKLKEIFQWTMENFDKILIAAGALFVGGKLLGAVGAVSGLLTIAKLLASPLGIGALLFSFGAWGPALFGKSSNDQRVDASVASLGKEETLRLLKQQLANENWSLWGKRSEIEDQIERVEAMEDVKKKAMGGETLGLTLVGERGPELAYFGQKANIVANHNVPKFVDDISNFSKSKVNLIEMDLGTIKKQPSTKQMALPESTEVTYVSSVNPMNSYMTKTPELHGICA
tara:strand:+ start:88 stop:1311 length:1224 start_codon:yes stop_codon:yes gene_type:complete